MSFKISKLFSQTQSGEGGCFICACLSSPLQSFMFLSKKQQQLLFIRGDTIYFERSLPVILPGNVQKSYQNLHSNSRESKGQEAIVSRHRRQSSLINKKPPVLRWLAPSSSTFRSKNVDRVILPLFISWYHNNRRKQMHKYWWTTYTCFIDFVGYHSNNIIG